MTMFDEEAWPRWEGREGMTKGWLNGCQCEEGQVRRRPSVGKGPVGEASLSLRSWKDWKLGGVTDTMP